MHHPNGKLTHTFILSLASIELAEEQFWPKMLVYAGL